MPLIHDSNKNNFSDKKGYQVEFKWTQDFLFSYVFGTLDKSYIKSHVLKKEKHILWTRLVIIATKPLFDGKNLFNIY